MGGGEVVPCHQCGGYRLKVRSRVLLTLRRRGKVTLLITLLTVTLAIAFRFRRCYSTHRYTHQRSKLQYDRMLPLIFIGGVPGSGSSLLRLHLDGHPDIRCRSESKIIPRVLRMYNHWVTDRKEHARLQEAGVTSQVLQAAVSALLLEVLVLSGDVGPYLCSQDPLSLHHAHHLSRIFPHARFLWVVRDGGPLVHDIIARQLQARGWSLKDVDHETEDNLRNVTSAMLEQWNNATRSMMTQCRRVGRARCRAVRYEQLVLSPRPVLLQVLRFLNVSWHEGVTSQSRFSKSQMEAGIPLDQSVPSDWQDEFPVNLADTFRPASVFNQTGFNSKKFPSDNYPTVLHTDNLFLDETHN